MSYGYFDDSRKEYIITNPHTPVKWINYVGKLEFGGLVDHTGGSLLCAGDPAINRIVKYLPQLPASEFKGQTMYLQVKGEDGTRIFSPFYVPTLDQFESYECRVGLGYQRIVSRFYGIETDVTIFIPDGEPVEIRDVKIRNLGEQPVEIQMTPVVEFTHFEALKQFTNADWVPQTMQCDAEWLDDGVLTLQQYAFMRRGTKVNWFTTNHPAQSFQTDRKQFLGNNEYGTWKEPQELLEEKLSNCEARRGDVIAAIRHDLGAVQPGEERRVICQLAHGTPEAIPPVLARYRDEVEVEKAFDRLGEFWSTYLSGLQCETPDAAFNTMVNIHNPRQCYMTLNWSRYLSLYQLGLGARGIGFRDTSQDIMGGLVSAPETCLKWLRMLLSTQRPDGSAMHQFNPLSMEANEGDAREEGEKLVYGDDHLWVVLATCAYLKETGHLAFLEEEITYYDKVRPLAERKSARVLDHLLAALDYTKANTGRHGLPLLGFADWNDTVNLPGDAESSFIACLYGRALLEMIELMEFLNDHADAARLRQDHTDMRDTFNRAAWDGEWYIRYFMENGQPIGSHTNEKGKIFTNGQSWPVLAGFAPVDRAQTALDSVHRHLNTDCGIKLSTPGYDGYDEEIGGISTFPPGAKENGGIFLHSNPWVMIAETLMGNGDRAFQYYRQINPAAKNDDIDRYECEPYCYAQNILGDEHPQFGLGRNSWLSGTASWTYQAATQYILGLQPRYDGLELAPCLPAGWKEVCLTRTFRGAVYRIRMSNPNGASRGVASISFDGQPLSGSLLPLCPAGTEHEIDIVLGAGSHAPVEQGKPQPLSQGA